MRTTILMLSWVLGCGDDVAEGADDELGQIVDWGQNSNAEDPTDTGQDDGMGSGICSDAAEDGTGGQADDAGADDGASVDTGETAGSGGVDGADEDTGGASAGSNGELDTAVGADVDSDADSDEDDEAGSAGVSIADPESADWLSGLQTYVGDWEVRIEVDSLGLSPSDDVCSGELTLLIDFDVEPPTVSGEGTCTFTTTGLISTFVAFGVADSIGPFAGTTIGAMISSVDATGVMPIEIIEGELLSIAWEGTLGTDGLQFVGDSSGTELVNVELPAAGEMEIPFDYEIDFETSLVE